jgi:hypothetical protein
MTGKRMTFFPKENTVSLRRVFDMAAHDGYFSHRNGVDIRKMC